LNIFIARRLIVAFFITLSLLAVMSIYFAVQKYNSDKVDLIKQHFAHQEHVIQTMSAKLSFLNEIILTSSNSITALLQSPHTEEIKPMGDVFAFSWGQKFRHKVSRQRDTGLGWHYQTIHTNLRNLNSNQHINSSYLIKQSGKFDFEYILDAEDNTPSELFVWLIRHGVYIDFDSKSLFNIPVIKSANQLTNFLIYPVYKQEEEKYFLIAELDSKLLSFPANINNKFVIWDPMSSYLLTTNIAIEPEHNTNSLLHVKKVFPSPYNNIIKQLNDEISELDTPSVKEVDGYDSVIYEQFSLGDDIFRLLLVDTTNELELAAFKGAKTFAQTLFLTSTFIIIVFAALISWLLAMPVSKLIHSIEGLHFKRTESKNAPAKGWEVWFSLLNQTYRQNKELLKTLTNRAHDLDAKVNARTQQLLEQTSTKDRNLALNRAMMNTIPDMLFYKSLDSKYLGCNSAYETFIGMSEQNIVHKTSREIFELSRAVWIEDFEQEVIAKKQSMVRKRWTRNSMGEAVLIRWLFSPIINNQNTVLGVLGLGNDITQQHHNVNELQKAVTAAEKANVVKGEFIANISHEIRTPMNSIIGMLELLDGINTDPSQKSFIGIAEHSAKSLLAVINNILDFSKANANKIKTELSVFNINDVLDNAFANSLPKAMKKGLLLDINLPMHFPQFFISDEVKLTQIFTNLIGNSVKFTQQGSVTVSAVLMEKVAINKQKVKFEVVDTGIGIAESDRQSVFEAFSQADSSVTREYGGTGLGLTIAYQLVRLLGGEITLESEPGVGTRFTLVFEFGSVEEQPRLEQIDHKLVYWETEAEIEKLIQGKLNTIGVDAKAINLQQKNDIELHNEQTVLLCRLELIEHIPQPVIDKIQSGVIRLQPITFTLQPSSSLSRIPHLPLLTAPVNIQTMLFNLHQQQIIYPNYHHTNAARLLGKHILIVEDNDLNQKVLELIFESEGATFTTCFNGHEALLELEKQPFDLIVTDIQMPVMDGLSLTNRIRLMDEFCELPIIAMSAHSSKLDIEKSLQAGINQHLTKPIDKTKLIEAILAFTQPELIVLSKQLQNQVDVQYLYNQVNQSVDAVLAILNKFHLSYYARLSVLLDDFEHLDPTARLELLHSFKGASGNIGAKYIHQLTKELEMQLIADSVLKHSVNLWQQSVKQLFSNLVVVLKLAK
jgi:PAS domain S-box-containing protein